MLVWNRGKKITQISNLGLFKLSQPLHIPLSRLLHMRRRELASTSAFKKYQYSVPELYLLFEVGFLD
jgi:hypothetical protein